VSTRQGKTFVVTCGQPTGPPVVLLHGAGFNSAAWTPDIATWASTHQIYALDVIGEPGQSASSRPPFDSDAYAHWLDDVLDELELSSAALVGASLGGWLAFDYAIRRPDRVRSIAALVPAGIGPVRYLPLLALLLAAFGRRGRQVATDLVLGPRPEPATDQRLAVLEVEMHEYLLLIQKSYRPRRDRLPVFSDDQLRQLELPVLVIAGAKDRLINATATRRRLNELLPHADVELRPGTGHIPTDYTTDIHRFLLAWESS
jgi:pimeloyl-ACP methyl ester carboxylesterase